MKGLLYCLFLSCLILTGCSVQRQPVLDGTEKVDYVRPEWFGAMNDGNTDCTAALQKMFDYMAKNNVYVCKFKPCDFGKGEFYLISKTIHIRKPVKIEGRKAFVSSKTVITYGDDPKHKSYLTDGIAFYFWGVNEDNPKTTDISLNIKVHAKPFFFNKIKNAYIHDCYVSTYTGDTEVTKGIYTFWFAFQCVDLVNARFRNVHIDQPTNGMNYNSADGIHLSGGCHDILIEKVYGQAGDDFIAMNTNENNSGDIYNVTIKNCTIGKESTSGSGIRFYGCTRLSHATGQPQLNIYNVSISNCFIKTNLSPCIFFTNNPDWKRTDNTSLKLGVDNVVIRSCTLFYESSRIANTPSIWMGGVECKNLSFKRVKSDVTCTEDVPFIKDDAYNEFHSLTVEKCKQNEISIKSEMK